MAQRELVDRASRGDQAAFADLATASIDRCYALAYRILRDPHRAQDATQQALIGAWRDLPTLRDLDRFDQWLHRLVVNACYVESRGTRRWIARIGIVDPIASTTTPDIATDVVQRDALERAFAQLTPERRAVVVMHHHLGYPLTEISAVLGIPTGTARSRLHHAVRQLRIALDAGPRSVASPEEHSA